MVLYVLKCYDSVNLCQVKNLETIVTRTLLHDYRFTMFEIKCAKIFFKKQSKKNIFCLLARIGKLNFHMDKYKFHNLYFVKFKFHLEKYNFHKLYFLALLQQKPYI